jgi:hypothetical protein
VLAICRKDADASLSKLVSQVAKPRHSGLAQCVSCQSIDNHGHVSCAEDVGNLTPHTKDECVHSDEALAGRSGVEQCRLERCSILLAQLVIVPALEHYRFFFINSSKFNVASVGHGERAIKLDRSESKRCADLHQRRADERTRKTTVVSLMRLKLTAERHREGRRT